MSSNAIIIHSCTRFCDYPAALTVAPRGVSSSVVESMRKIILASTKSIDTLDKSAIRLVIFTVEDYVMTGMVTYLSNLASNDPADERFYTDDYGRGIYAFVGMVFKIGEPAPALGEAVLWNGFKRYMSSIWERRNLDLQFSEFEDVAELSDAGKLEGGELIGDVYFYSQNGDDRGVFNYWLLKASNGQCVSFCSNIVDYRVIKGGFFNVITTNSNNIERYRHEQSNQESVLAKTANSMPVSQKKKETSSVSEITSVDSRQKNNSKTMWIIIGIILFIVFVLMKMIMR